MSNKATRRKLEQDIFCRGGWERQREKGVCRADMQSERGIFHEFFYPKPPLYNQSCLLKISSYTFLCSPARKTSTCPSS